MIDKIQEEIDLYDKITSDAYEKYKTEHQEEIVFHPFSERLLEQKEAELAKVKQQLAIAVEALENIKIGNKTVIDMNTGEPYYTESLALRQIKELEK